MAMWSQSPLEDLELLYVTVVSRDTPRQLKIVIMQDQRSTRPLHDFNRQSRSLPEQNYASANPSNTT
jgi:hypothetical protein